MNFSGGELELDLCAWYIISWEFKKDKSQMKCINTNLYIQSPNGKRIKSKQLQNNIPTTYLGVTSQVNGEQSAQTNILYENARRISRNLCCSHLSHYNGHIYQQCVSNLILSYPLVASSMSDKKINKIQQIIHPQVIVYKGFNRNWPKALPYGKHELSGLELMNLRVEQRVRKLQFMQKMLLHPKHKGFNPNNNRVIPYLSWPNRSDTKYSNR